MSKFPGDTSSTLVLTAKTPKEQYNVAMSLQLVPYGISMKYGFQTQLVSC